MDTSIPTQVQKERTVTMKKTLILSAILCFIASGVHAETIKIPLYKLTPENSVDLKCIQGEYKIAIPVPERWKIRKAVLTLAHANSNNLIADRSQLVVKMNGSLIGQIRLNPLTPEGKTALSIPAAMLKSDYNSLSFHSALHYTTECEQFCAPNLWTTLNFFESLLEIDYELLPVPLKLSAVSHFLFDPKIWPSGDVHIITENLSSDAATMAGIVASGVARKFDYRKVSFSISNDVKPGNDNILIGSKKFVEAFLKPRGVDINVPGPFLKIMHLPSGRNVKNSLQALIVVSGNSQDEIKMAAETLALMTLPYPGTDELVVKDFKLPDIAMYGGRQILTTDKDYTFRTLDFGTHTFVGFNPNAMDISFRLPADFLVKPNKYARMDLNFVYGAGMRNDSVLNIMINEKIVRVVHLGNPNGETFEGYRIDLPTYLFKPGFNSIRFAPVLNPVSKECDQLRPEGFFLTVFENSTFYFPSMPHFVEMPKIELFLLDGFPITRRPDGYESMFYLTLSDYDTVASALNVIGIISQKNGYPLFGTKISFEKPAKWKGELLILGDVTTIPEEFMKMAPLKIAQKSVVPYPVIRNWESETSLALSGQVSAIGPALGVVMEYQSPYKTGRSVFQVTGASAKEVLAVSKALLEPSVQNQMRGDLVLLDLNSPDYRVKALSAGTNYYTGQSGAFFLIEYYFYKYTYLNYILLFLFIILFSLAVYYLLQKVRKKRAQK
jgi:cellulose synthase operon protein B